MEKQRCVTKTAKLREKEKEENGGLIVTYDRNLKG